LHETASSVRHSSAGIQLGVNCRKPQWTTAKCR
jgi:hypothetical protein